MKPTCYRFIIHFCLFILTCLSRGLKWSDAQLCVSASEGKDVAFWRDTSLWDSQMHAYILFFQLSQWFPTHFVPAPLWHNLHFPLLMDFSFYTINFHFLGLLFCSFEIYLCQEQGLHDPVVLALQHPSLYYQLLSLHFKSSISLKSKSTISSC